MTGGTAMRGRILADLKGALAQGGDDTERRKAVARRLEARSRHLVPARGRDVGAAAVDRFQAEAERSQATVARISDIRQLPHAVADYLAAQNLPAEVRLAPDPRLAAPDWSQTALAVSRGAARDADSVGISHAFGGVAETGTLVLLSGPDNPTTVNFLPPVHVAVVRAADIDGGYEDSWARLRQAGAAAGGGFMPRTVNWITGPSRTADIELTLFLGIHGPKNLHIVIVEDDGRGS